MAFDPGLVFFLSSEWERYHRPGLLRALASLLPQPTLVVDNPVCLATSRWQRPGRWQAWQAAAGRGVGARLQPVGDRLVRLDAAVPLHDRIACRWPGVRELNRSRLAAQVRAALAYLGRPAPQVTWFQFPTHAHYPGLLDEGLPVYECYDEHADVPGRSAAERSRLRRLERRLMQRCRLVVVTSKPLYAARSTEHGNVVLSYNAADAGFFAAVGAHSLATVAARRGCAPTVGYLGTIHEHTDVDLLAEIAERRPQWPLLVVGPVQPGAPAAALRRLRAAANVELHGWVDAAALPRLLERIDVGIIPYRSEARFNRFVNPNKLHEYTAMGKPVVASPGLDASSHPGLVDVAAGADAFIAAIARLHAADDVAAVRRRLDFARRNDWTARARDLLGHLERGLAAGGLRREGADR